MPNSNGLIAGSTTFNTGDPESYLYVRRDVRNGNSTIDGDLTVEGNLLVQGDSTLPVIRAVDISLNPVYIRNPENLGINPITESAVIIEGGADRIDISDQAVALTLFKPFSSTTIGYQQVGALQFAGVNTAGTPVRYGSIRGVSRNATSGATKGMLEFQVIDGTLHSTRMEIDASANVIRTDGGSRFQDRGYNLYPAGVKINAAGSITKQATATLVPESEFTIPTNLDGYWSFTAQVLLGTVTTVDLGDIFSLFLDISGGSLTPLVGTSNVVHVAENSSNAISFCCSGIIGQRLVAGEIVRLFHLEAGTFDWSTGSVQVSYNYLGDGLLA
jgi:hypothetical protein